MLASWLMVAPLTFMTCWSPLKSSTNKLPTIQAKMQKCPVPLAKSKVSVTWFGMVLDNTRPWWNPTVFGCLGDSIKYQCPGVTVPKWSEVLAGTHMTAYELEPFQTQMCLCNTVRSGPMFSWRCLSHQDWKKYESKWQSSLFFRVKRVKKNKTQLPYSTLEWIICVASLLNLKYCALHITAHETIE